MGMVDVAESLIVTAIGPPKDRWIDFSVRFRTGAEYVVIPLFALALAGLVFALFLLVLGKSPAQFFELVVRGGFGTAFSIQNTLQRSAPLILTALAVAVPARIGLVMIGGEGALVLGGFASAVIAIPLVIGQASPAVAVIVVAAAGIVTRAPWDGTAGILRHAPRGHADHSALLL